MSTNIVNEKDWAAYFSRLPRLIKGKTVKIEVVGPSLGDQVLVQASLIGATYEPKRHALEISVEGLTHVIENPQKVSVEDDGGKVVAIEVIDLANQHQILTFS